MELFILADDFTGALDTGVQFAKRDISTQVLLNTESRVDADAEVLVLNLGCRHMAPHGAYTAAKRALERFPAPHVYIKTDSALRGNLSAVFAAALGVFDRPICFVPAFPQTGRTTKAGVHYINGVKLEQSVFRDDPLNPMRTSGIAGLLSADYDIPVKLVSNTGYAAAKRGFRGIYVFDCESQDDLREIASTLSEKNILGLTAGCAGFASVLPEFMGFKRSHRPRITHSGGLLCICGSANNVSFKQLENGARSGMRLVFLQPRDVLGDTGISAYADEALRALSAGEAVMIATARHMADRAPYREAYISLGVPEEQIHRRIVSYLSRLAKICVDEVAVSNLALIGGDTACAVLSALGIAGVKAVSEIETGVAVSEAHYAGRALTLITKSGGLGGRDVFLNILKYIK